MNPQDDPEARIRALEQPLADNARASEVGSNAYTGGGAYQAPPVPPMPPPVTGPDYGNQYGANQYAPPGYGAPWGQPPKKVSAGIPWIVLGIGAVIFMAIAAGVGFVIVNRSTSTFPDIPGVSMPSFPSMPSTPGMPVQPTEAPPGGALSVAGMGENKTLECNDNRVSISGVSNTVTITGHCTTITVSGMQNKVTLDTADQISASGFDNVITYHSGSPDINNAGNNTVQQG